MPFFHANNTGQLESSFIWAAVLLFGTALACFVCLRLTRVRIAARRREEALVIAAHRAQIDAEAAAAAAAAAAAEAAEAGEGGGGGRGRGGRRGSSTAHDAAAAAPRLSRTMIARLPTFNYVDPPAGQGSDEEEGEGGFVKGGNAAAAEQPSGGDAAAAAAVTAAPPPKKTFVRSSSSGKRRCIVCLDPLSSEKVMALPCGHLFHSNCVGDWLERHATCPECRTEITSSLISALGDDDEEGGGVRSGGGGGVGGGEQQQQQQATQVETGGRRSHRRHHHGRWHR